MAASPGPISLTQATCVLVGAGAVLIRGKPGAGKSTLAAALLSAADAGRLVRLVADDAVLLRAAAGRLVAVAPEPIRGAIEMRGVGIVAIPFESRAVVRLVVDLVAPDEVERMPEREQRSAILCGLELPRIALPASDPASRERVLAALASAAGGRLAPGEADGESVGNADVAAVHKDSIRA